MVRVGLVFRDVNLAGVGRGVDGVADLAGLGGLGRDRVAVWDASRWV